jgi:hypothetical protein
VWRERGSTGIAGAATILVVLVLAACDDQSAHDSETTPPPSGSDRSASAEPTRGSGESSPADPSVPTFPRPLVDQGVRLASPTLASRALVADWTSLPWVVVEESKREITLRATEGGCAVFDQFRMHESDNQILIAAIAVRPRADNSICNASMGYVYRTLQLEAPMGSRRLVHAPVTRHWASQDT